MVTTRSTVKTTRSGGGPAHQVIPLWTIKLVTALLSLVILVLVLLQSTAQWQRFPKTYVALVLTTGYLLGWSLPSVLHRFLPFHRVDVALHSCSLGLALLSLVLGALYLVDNHSWSRTDDYRFMVGIVISLAVEVILLFVLVAWVCYGNYTIVDNQ